MKSRIALLLIVCGSAQPLRADPPVASYIFPAGGRRGTDVDVRVGGLNLYARCGFELLGPGVAAKQTVVRTEARRLEGPILPLPESQQQEDYPRDMAGRVHIENEAPVGLRIGRVWTSQGAASGLGFVIGDLPEVVERESEGPAEPVRVNWPVTVNGRIYPNEDVDEWAFSARQGQCIAAELNSTQFGSPLVARLELRDSTGRKIHDQDPHPGEANARLQFTAPADGVYRLRVYDARFLGGPAYIYRLTIRARPAESLDAPIPTRTLTCPAEVRGRIAVPGETDGWPVALTKGRPYEVDVRARRIRSPLFPVVIVRDPMGKEVTRQDSIENNSDPILQFSPSVDGIHRVEIKDRFKARGGAAFGYQLSIRDASPSPDFRLSLASDTITVPRGGMAKLKLTAERLGGFSGPIDISFDGLSPGVSVSKTTLAGNQTSVETTIAASSTSPITISHVTIRGTAKIGARAETRMARAPSLDPAKPIESILLAIALPTPFVVKADYQLSQAPRGTVFIKRYRIERNGFNGPITVSLADRQARHLQGVTGPSILVSPNQSEFDYPITMPPWMETGRTCRVCVMAVGEVTDSDGTRHEVGYSSTEQHMQIIVVMEPGRLGLEPGHASIRRGDSTLVVRVQRGEGLVGSARVEILPGSGASAEPISIGADSNSGTLKLRFDPRHSALNQTMTIRATVLDHGSPVTAEANVEIVPD